MSNLIINKSSGGYATISLCIINFLLMVFFYLSFSNGQKIGSSADNFNIYVSVENDSLSNLVKNWISKEYQNSTSTIINPMNGLKSLEYDLGEDMYNKLQKNNPLPFIVKSNILQDLNNELKTNLSENIRILGSKKVSFEKNNVIDPQYSLVGLNWALSPLIFVTILFCYLILRGSTQSQLSLNQKEITKFIIAGANPGKLFGEITKIYITSNFVGWLLGIVLFILTFYLFTLSWDQKFSDLSVIILIKALFSSLFITLLFSYFIPKGFVKSFLKRI